MEKISDVVIQTIGKLPAFPAQGIGAGLSQVEYFMAHAPANVPDWFRESINKRPEFDKTQFDMTDPFVDEHIKAAEYRFNQEYRYFQWRLYYAKEMIRLTI